MLIVAILAIASLVVNSSARGKVLSLQKLQLILLDLDGEDGDSLGSINDNVLILTVKPGWMSDILKALNHMSERENDVLFITDRDCGFMLSQTASSRHNISGFSYKMFDDILFLVMS
ncbi:hypothetical protein [Paenibacillus sp. FSL R10-2734]|uniref:hypothetical protein n=1 Tax=Paenibacillus sp. FSL R10-2734 TaxID=2954691 RepID=UPI0030DA6EE7